MVFFEGRGCTLDVDGVGERSGVGWRGRVFILLCVRSFLLWEGGLVFFVFF